MSTRVTHVDREDTLQQQREEMRRSHGLRLVADAEEGEVVKYMKGCVYGFSYAPMSLDTGLFAKPTYLCYEMHKLGDNTVYVIGVVSPEMKKKILAGGEDIEIEFYPEVYGEATELMAIPVLSLAHPKPPNRIQGNMIKAHFQQN